VRTIVQIGWLSTFGSGSMAAAMATLCAKLLFVEPRPDEVGMRFFGCLLKF